MRAVGIPKSRDPMPPETVIAFGGKGLSPGLENDIKTDPLLKSLAPLQLTLNGSVPLNTKSSPDISSRLAP